MKRNIQRLAGWILGTILLLWRRTCRYEVRDDPRPALRAQRRAYVYALLHAHQIGAVMLNDDADGIAAMVSRSRDGDLLAPALRLTGVVPVRGSTRRKGKERGGREALAALEDHVRRRQPALLAIDGPVGPRNHVHRGVAELAQRTDAVVLPCVVLGSRRWVLRTWDRMQVPQPFSRVRLCFAAPLDPRAVPDVEVMRTAIGATLDALERREDPDEAARGATLDAARGS